MINEFRRAKRRKAADTILVTDVMTERVVGRIGNISETGMLMMSSESLAEDALFQFRFLLRDAEAREAPVEVGAHLLWMDRASAPGQSWTGFRFIGLTEAQGLRLRAWIEAPGSQYE
jgi:hypothetical protein